MDYPDYVPACVLALKAEVEAAGLGLDYCEITGCQTGAGCRRSVYLTVYDRRTDEPLATVWGKPDQLEELVTQARRMWKEEER